MKIDVYWDPDVTNVGDTLTGHLLNCLRPDLEIRMASRLAAGKFLGVGSLLDDALGPENIVWGSGAMYENSKPVNAPSCRFLAVRGHLSRDMIERFGGKVPAVFGDPGLLMPLIYQPVREVRYEIGYVPHLYDFREIDRRHGSDDKALVIDVRLPVGMVLDQICQCARIEASSLHGLVLSEAYGVPAEWAVYSNKVPGGSFKFRDYLTGTGRAIQRPGVFPPIPDLPGIQRGLLEALDGI